jgi:hypothetical protein
MHKGATHYYQEDLAYIQSVGFGDLARGAAPEILRRLRAAHCPVRRIVDVGCGAGPLARAFFAVRATAAFLTLPPAACDDIPAGTADGTSRTPRSAHR